MNSLRSRISKVVNYGQINRVEVTSGGLQLNIITLQLAGNTVAGEEVFVLFKETEVIISRSRISVIGADNIIPAVVIDIRTGNLFSEISLDSVCGKFKSIVAASSIELSDMMIGEHVNALIKSNGIAFEWQDGG